MKKGEGALKALAEYRVRGIVSIAACLLFVAVLIFVSYSGPVNFAFIFLLLFTGFFWIGMTSLSRHSYVIAKRAIGKEATVIEFLGTQFAVLLFPLIYRRLKKEVDEYRQQDIK